MARHAEADHQDIRIWEGQPDLILTMRRGNKGGNFQKTAEILVIQKFFNIMPGSTIKYSVVPEPIFVFSLKKYL